MRTALIFIAMASVWAQTQIVTGGTAKVTGGTLVAQSGTPIILGGTPVIGGGGGGGPTMLTHLGTVLGVAGGTTSAINSTGGTCALVWVTADSGGVPTLSDSQGGSSNVYTALTSQAATVEGKLYYAHLTHAGTGHTFTVTGAASYSSIFVQIWNTLACTLQTGSDQGVGSGTCLSDGTVVGSATITASSVVVTGQGDSATGSEPWSVNSSMTISDRVAVAGGNNYGGAMAWLVKSSGTISPAWTGAATGYSCIAAMGVFQ